MQLTMIREDGLVIIDGRGLYVDLSDMPTDLHAVQWYGNSGHVERPGWMNQPIASLGDFQTWIDRWNAAAEAIDNAPPPPVPVPRIISRYQGRAALFQAGYLDDVEAYMALETTDPLEKLAWADIQEFDRTSALLLKMGSMLGLTDAQIDDLFRFAATIKA